MDRYPFTSVEDSGLGADEFGGPRRFTRPVERILSTPVTAVQVDDDLLDPRVRLRMLDRAADALHDVVLETPRSDEHRDRLRDLAVAVKDAADEFARSHNLRADRPGQEDARGSAATDSAGDVHPTITKELN